MTPPTWPTLDWKASVNAVPVVPANVDDRPVDLSVIAALETHQNNLQGQKATKYAL
jgi:hypothetical protein